MFDLARLDTRTKSENGVDMPIKHPTTGAAILDDTGKPVTIKMAGPNSDKFRAAQRDATARRTDMASRNVPITPDDVKRENYDYLVATTMGWSDSMTMDGEPFAFSVDNVRKLWADERFSWLIVQMLNSVFDSGNFIALS